MQWSTKRNGTLNRICFNSKHIFWTPPKQDGGKGILLTKSCAQDKPHEQKDQLFLPTTASKGNRCVNSLKQSAGRHF